MKKVGMILATCLLIASCNSNNPESAEEKQSYSIKYAMENTNTDKLQTDTLRVKVLILGNDTLSTVVRYEDIEK